MNEILWYAGVLLIGLGSLLWSWRDMNHKPR